MKYSALVPVKELALAKSRLASHLSALQRENLVLDMLSHVIHTLCESEIFEQIYVVSSDQRVLELTQSWGAEPLQETHQGHNPALQAAALTIMERATWRHGHYARQAELQEQWTLKRETKNDLALLLQEEALLTISADLPLLSCTALLAMVELAERFPVVLAGSGDGTGTNALLTRPPLALPYLFGPGSLPAYIQAARRRHISYTLYPSPELALDIDTRADLQMLEQHSRPWPCTASFVT